MHDLTILLLGVIIGLVLGVVVSALRRTPVVGGPASIPPELRESRSTVEPAAAKDLAAAHEPNLAADSGPIPIGAADLTTLPTGIPGQTRLRYSKTVVKRRIATTVTPDGIAVTVDGATYHGIDEIPDPATREQVRKTLAGLPAEVTEPVLRAKIEGELEGLGITPDPHA